MNKRRPQLLLILFPLIFVGCTGSLFTIAPEGDYATISLVQNPPFTAELLAIDLPDNLLYVKLKNQEFQEDSSHVNEIAGVDLDKIRSITIQDYNNKEWVLPWVALQVVPTIFLGIAAAQEDATGAVIIFGIPTIMSGLLFTLSSQKSPKIGSEFTSSTLKELNKYTRFPLGLNSGQLQKLLQVNNQKDLRIIGAENPIL